MKVKVVQSFNDKVTREYREAGKTYEYETERAKELIARGFVEKVVTKEDADKTEKDAEIDEKEPKTAKKKLTK